MEDKKYYIEGAKNERQRAAQAERADVADVHLELAKHYEALAANPDLRPGARKVWPET